MQLALSPGLAHTDIAHTHHARVLGDGSLTNKPNLTPRKIARQAETAAKVARKAEKGPAKMSVGRRAAVGQPKSSPLPEMNRLAALAENELPPYAVRDWSLLAKADGLNSYAGQPLPERCQSKELTFKDRKPGPNGAPVGPCFQLDRRSATQTQPVLPTLFVPGFPKCATTWLYECMHQAFIPEAVCSTFDTMPLKRQLW